MLQLLLVCAGGAAGSGARFLVANWSARTLGTSWPVGTLLVNVAGSFLMGVLVSALSGRTGTDNARLLLGAGVLGGFTTYSSFNAELLQLLGDGRGRAAAIYLVLTVGVAVAAGVLGLVAGRPLAG